MLCVNLRRQIKNQQFVIGEMSYKVVVLPNMLVIRHSTLNLLKQFKASGGVILAFGKYPDMVDGVRNSEAIDSLKNINRFVEEKDFLKELDNILAPDYKLEGLNNKLIWTHYSKVANGGILQLSNTSRLKKAECELSFSSAVNKLALWNPENGHSVKLVPGIVGKIRLHFDATKSWLVTYGEASKEAILTDRYEVPAAKKEVIKIAGPWHGNRIDPNALTLDFASYSTDNGQTYSNPEPVIGIHQRLLNKRYVGRLLMKFKAEVNDVPEKRSLIFEQPKLYTITVNGREIKFFGKEYYRDQAFKVQDILGTLKKGTNEILLSVNYVAPKPSSLNAYERYGTEI